jgi:sigma-B regulation protein RsbU (phosphoserine phosphatase)
LRWESLLIALLFLPVFVLGVVLWRRAPEHGPLEKVTPSYVSALERDARLAGEVEALREFQLLLLPRAATTSELSQADVAWRMIPADTVGGDFLDLIEDDNGRLWIAVADAAGHGISCSVLTAFTKAAVTEHVGAETSPAEALSGIRRLFRRLHTRRTMVTLLLAVWDPRSRRLTVANAGHPPLLFWDGHEVSELGHPGSPLGTTLKGDADREETVEVPIGAVVVGYSDGVPEANAPSGETYGYEAWPAMLGEIAPEGLNASGILEELLAGVTRHRAGQQAEDDLTAVVLRLDEA